MIVGVCSSRGNLEQPNIYRSLKVLRVLSQTYDLRNLEFLDANHVITVVLSI